MNCPALTRLAAASGQVAVDAHAKGVLSKILVQPGDVVPVDSPIAHFVDDMKEYMELVEQVRVHVGCVGLLSCVRVCVRACVRACVCVRAFVSVGKGPTHCKRRAIVQQSHTLVDALSRRRRHG